MIPLATSGAKIENVAWWGSVVQPQRPMFTLMNLGR